MAVHFIPGDLVFTIHADLLQRYGGSPGLRDRHLLDSALAQPKITVVASMRTKLTSRKLQPTDTTSARTIRSSMATNGLLSY